MKSLPFVACSVFTLLLTACDSSDNSAAAAGGMPPAAVSTIFPVQGDMKEGLSVVGSLVASESALISAEVSGNIDKVAVHDGQSVNQGDLLFEITADALKAELKRAKADVKLRADEKKRIESLYEKRVSSKTDVDKAEALLDTAYANLDFAQANLDKKSIKAPFSGRVGIRKVNRGDYVQPGQALIELVKANPLYVDFRMPETVLASITDNAEIDVVVPAMNDKKIIATVIAIEPFVDIATRSVMVRAKVDNKNLLLRPGLFARVLLPLKTAENILWLPEAALFLNGDKKMVLINDDGKALRKEVEVISYQHGRIAISKGLNASDEVVIAGHHKAPFDGMPLMVVNPPADVEKAAPAESAKTEQIQQ